MELRRTSRILYREEQRFAPFLYDLLIGAITIGAIVLAIRNLKVPEPVLAGFLGAVIIAGLMNFFRLVVEVRNDGLYVRLIPFPWKRINLSNLISHQPVTYHPIRQYGGWGLRITFRGRAYTIWGNRGVRLEFADGKHILIGSNYPERLDEAIRQLLENR
jgi:hypothetical protein